MSIYQDIEEAIVARLEPFRAAGFNVLPLPEVQADYEKPFQNGRITVAYHSSEYQAPPQSTSQTSQWEEVRMIVAVESRQLRAAGKGVYDLMAIVRRYLVGFQPPGCERIWAKEAGLKRAEYADNVWTYYCLFCTKTLAVEDFTEEPLAEELAAVDFENMLTGAEFGTETL